MKSLKYLNKYLFKYKNRLVLGVVFIAISNVFGLYPAQIIRQTFDAVEAKLKGQALDSSIFFSDFITELSFTQLFLFFGSIVFGLAILKGLFTFFTRQTIIIMSRLIEFDLKNEIFNHYQDLDVSFYKNNNTGDIMNRISEDVSKVRMYLGPGLMYSINLIVLFALIVPIMFSISVKLSIYVLTPLPILSVLIYFVSNRINQQSEKVQSQQSKITTLSQETYSGIRIIKSFVKETFFKEKMVSENETYRKLSLNLVKTNAFFHPLMMLLIGLSTIFTIYIGGLEAMNDSSITTGNIAEFVIYVNMLTWPVTAIGWVTSIIQRAAASQERINQFLSTKPNIINPSNKPISIQGNISFKNVHFTYPESGIKALKDISFTIEQGKTFAIVGKTGSGKSTILNLLLRNYDPTSGSIRIDNHKLNSINLNQYRNDIGFVSQEVFLFSDTIANNIAFGYKKEINRDLIENAAKHAAIYDNIINFPKGFDTYVGERGVTLSGGQKQRISIARAIIKNPKILIFDDCLSAVDTETEEIILNNLKKIMLNKTSIIVSHRISTVKNADNIIVIKDGKITEQGTHEELLNNKAYYYDTYQKQMLETEFSNK